MSVELGVVDDFHEPRPAGLLLHRWPARSMTSTGPATTRDENTDPVTSPVTADAGSVFVGAGLVVIAGDFVAVRFATGAVADFLAVVFFTADDLAVDVLAIAFFGVDFFAVGFLGAGFSGVGFLGVAFWAVAVVVAGRVKAAFVAADVVEGERGGLSREEAGVVIADGVADAGATSATRGQRVSGGRTKRPQDIAARRRDIVAGGLPWRGCSNRLVWR